MESCHDLYNKFKIATLKATDACRIDVNSYCMSAVYHVNRLDHLLTEQCVGYMRDIQKQEQNIQSDDKDMKS